MNIQPKNMILNITLDSPTEFRIVIADENGNVIRDDGPSMYIEDEMDELYFDDWEAHIKNIPWTNITSVNRFR